MSYVPEQSVVFLMYHELDTPARSLCRSEPGYTRYVVRTPDFEAQMRFLKSAGWHGSNISQALSCGATPGVAVTFDDGCETDLLNAAPVLLEVGFGATFYVTVGFLGRQGYMSLSQVRELCDLSFEIGCHSMTHAYLTDLDGAGLDREIVEPKLRLEQILGRSIDHFSCPGGRFNQRVVETARRAGYRSLANSGTYANTVSTDRFALGRVAIMRRTPLRSFSTLCRGRGLWQMSVRNGMRQGARALMGNSSYDRIRAAVLGQDESR